MEKNNYSYKKSLQLENIVNIATGFIILFLGLLDLSKLKGQIAKSNFHTSCFKIFICISLIVIGIKLLIRGYNFLFMGKKLNLPNLSQIKNKENSKKHFYKIKDLHEIFEKRVIINKLEPLSFIDKFLYEKFPKLIDLSIPLRNINTKLFTKTFYTLFLIFIYLVTSFLINIKFLKANSLDWASIILAFLILILWSKNEIKPKIKENYFIEDINKTTLTLFSLVLILIPFSIELLNSVDAIKLKAPFAPIYVIWYYIFFILLSFCINTYLISRKVKVSKDICEYSKYSDLWRIESEPKIFIENLKEKFKKYFTDDFKVYQDKELVIDFNDKNCASFEYEYTIETNVEIIDKFKDSNFKFYCNIVSLFGNVLILISTFVLFFNKYADKMLFKDIFNKAYLPITMITFGFIIMSIANVFKSEITFKSNFISFYGKGNYLENCNQISFNVNINFSSVESSSYVLNSRKVIGYDRVISSLEKNDEELNKLVENISK